MPSEFEDVLTNQPVVLDNGSGTIKAGFAGQDTPKSFFPNFVGRPKHPRVMAGAVEGDRFIGRKAQELRGLLRVRYPMEHGIVNDWADMERIWSYVYTDGLKTQSEEHPVLLTEAPLNPRTNRDTAAQIFFETFNVPAMYISIQAVLSLYSSGRTTGVVLDSGDGVTHAVPVYEGFALPHAIRRVDVAGRDVSDHLQMLLRRSGYYLHTSSEREIVRAIKEKCCQLATYPGHEEREAKRPVEFTLPDGNIIKLNEERFRAPEILFNPELVGLEDAGAHQILADSIGRADMDLRRNLYGNIVLSGGTTLTKGYGDRLLHEIKTLAPVDTKIKISAPPERKYSTWIGGSIFAGLSTFRKMWISAQDYMEDPHCIHKGQSLCVENPWRLFCASISVGARFWFGVTVPAVQVAVSDLHADVFMKETILAMRYNALLPQDTALQVAGQAHGAKLAPYAQQRDFSILRVQGSGSFGSVYIADWRSPLPSDARVSAMQHGGTRAGYVGKHIVAIKRIRKQFDDWNDCLKLNELRALSRIPSHDHIIPLYDAFLPPSTKELHIVFESMEGNLYQLIRTRKGRLLTAGLMASILKQVLLGLDHIHQHGFFHRDIKPENLLITTTGLGDYPTSIYPYGGVEQDAMVIVKIADFGLAREIQNTSMYTEYVSTRWYRAPEVLLRSPYYSSAVDIWALGAIMVELATLEPLFPGVNEVDQIMRICSVLGSPMQSAQSLSAPMMGGGPWKEARALCEARGVQIPASQPIPFDTLFPAHTSRNFVQLLFSMLRYDPALRPDTKACLAHTFLQSEAPLLCPHTAADDHKSQAGSLRPNSRHRCVSDEVSWNAERFSTCETDTTRVCTSASSYPEHAHVLSTDGPVLPYSLWRRSTSHSQSISSDVRASVSEGYPGSSEFNPPEMEGTWSVRHAPKPPETPGFWAGKKQGNDTRRLSKEEQLKRREAESALMRDRSRAVMQKRMQIIEARTRRPTPDSPSGGS
ncbi:centractin- actin- protein of the dynactin complex [Malassezia vespertilionis]|uniref:Centractin n=1 Tax=Malassezia vespertilionis TaxID=2020962 RepID=A0A2N1JBK3_9BASI|nr:centractin- actin- protein of the dynactin complex [Malassezia vespertilionis]PKI83928.1 hypothetical protein MVES_001989 [Malassezia vespertilionis]WFD06752.1 centractin- actin- protein of the dynactin complex [Malassezia vespertilionis]